MEEYGVQRLRFSGSDFFRSRWPSFLENETYEKSVQPYSHDLEDVEAPLNINHVYGLGIILWSYLLFVVLAPRPVCVCTKRLDGKIAIVTGGSDGVGKETAFKLAKRGAILILPCRNIEKGEKVAQEIREKTGNQQISVTFVDFTSLTSVQICANEICQKWDKIDLLVNNAGIGNGVNATRDGYPMVFGVNHLAPFLFTTTLLPILRKSGSARIIFVSSIAHLWGKINFERIQTLDNGSVISQFRAYSQSKLANVLFAKQLHKNERKHGISTYVAHPGWTFTSIFRDFPFFLKLLVFPIFHLFLYRPSEGAQTQIHLALASGIENVSGGYFAACEQTATCQSALDGKLAKKLWTYSQNAVTRSLTTP